MGSASGTKAPSQRAVLVKEKRQARLRHARRDPQVWRYLVSLCEAVILLVVAWQLYRHALEIRPMVAAGFQFDYEEGNILNALSRIAHGLSPYPDPHGYPNVLNPYGPVAYYVLAVPVKLLGLSFTGPRLVIVSSVFVICIFVSLLVARITRSKVTGLAFGFMYGTFGLVRDWSAILRIDFLALALTTAGLYFFSRTQVLPTADHSAGKEPSRNEARDQAPLSNGRVFTELNYWLASILFTAAIFTKPNCVAAPAACLALLLLGRCWREALRFCAMGVALCAASLATVWAATHGTIVTHLFFSHPDQFSWSAYTERLAQLPAMFAPLLVLAMVAFVAELIRRDLSLGSLWLILSTATAATAGKLGSNWNHFLEWPIALCICAAMGWTIVTRLRPRALAAALAIVATLWLALNLMAQKQSKNYFAQAGGCPAAYQFVRSQPGDRILSENVGALVLGGKKVWVSNLFVYTQLIENAGWKDAGMKPMIESRSFDLVVASRNFLGNKNYALLGADRFSPEAIQALAQNYHAVAAFECKDAAFMFAPNR